MIRNIKHFIKNLWKYRFFLFKDRDWDYAFLYNIMQLKLDNMYIECMNGNAADKSRYKHIKIASKLITIIRDETYLDAAYNTFPSKINIERDFYGWLNEKNFQRDVAVDLAYKKQDKAKKLLFKIMYEKIDYWWD